MHKIARRTRAFTLIELTVLLVLLVTLALVLAPSVASRITDSRVERARADCRAIADGIVRFYRDTGVFPQWLVPPAAVAGGEPAGLDLLVTEGNAPGARASTMALEDEGLLEGWAAGRVGRLADQLTTNSPGYLMKTGGQPGGWNGPYLPSAVGPDPWDNCYVVNVGDLEGDRTAAARPRNAVWALSAGPNGVVETAFRQGVAAPALGGDDIAVRIQ